MKKTLFLILAILFCLLPGKTRAQTDSVEIQPDKIGIWYFGIGGGAVTRGGTFDLSFTMTSINYWGGSVNFRAGILKSENVPSDYYEDGLREIAPKDYLDVVTLNLVKKFPTIYKSVRFGVEAGPSWVRYNTAEFTLNPDYNDPEDWWWPFPRYKYFKSHVAENTAGLSLAAKVEFPVIFFMSFDLSLYTVINNIQSIVGLDICIDFGKVGNE